MNSRAVPALRASGRARDAEVAEHALRLRRWALAVLAGADAGAGAREAVEAPAEAWRTFLHNERCTLALRRLPGAAPVFAALAEPARSVVEGMHLREMQQAMSARMQMATLGRVAQRDGVPTVVLKGGVAIAEGEPVHVADVDVLVPDDRALAFGETLLSEHGFRRDTDDLVHPRGGHHLAPRSAPDALQVEVHFRLPGLPADGVLARAVPLAGHPALLRPAPEDHLLHLLHHTVEQHPERLGRLREVLLIGAAAADEAVCAAALRGLGGGVTGRRGASLLAFARRVRAGEAGPDPFSRVAAAIYLLTAEIARTGTGPTELTAWSVFAMVHGRADYLAAAGQLIRRLDGRVTGTLGQRVERVVPSLVPPLRFCRRAARVIAAAPRAWPLVRWAWRLVPAGEARAHRS